MEIKDIISSGILELYAAGLTSEKETEDVGQWLLQYPEIATELNGITGSVEAYAQSYAVTPAAIVKEKLFAQINARDNNVAPIGRFSTNSDGRTIGIPPYWRVAAAASILLLIGSIVLNLVTYNKFAEADKQLVIAQQSLNALEEKDKNISRDLSVVQSKYSVPVSLKGLEAAPDAAAKIFWMKNTGEVFIDASNLPVAPAGKQYQLWGFVDGKPVDGGMLMTTPKGDVYRMQKMKSFGKAEAFAITLEPEKGNPTPQGPIYVMGKM